MQPFVEKLTGIEPKSGSGTTDSDVETTTDSRCVNTSLLAASKLIYVEAIAVYYKHNTIHFDAELCANEDIVLPRATDLSLARHVIVKMDDALDPELEDRFSKALNMSLTIIPTIFSKARTCSVYISTDTGTHPLTDLIILYCKMRQSDLFNDIQFDGVGWFHACLTRVPGLKFILQSERAVDAWARSTEIPAAPAVSDKASAIPLYQGSRADSQNVYGRTAQRLFDVHKKIARFPELEDVKPDGFEFWTCVDACLYLCEQPFP